MARIRLRKGVEIGALSAEADSLLDKVFLDTGTLGKLLDVSGPRFIILGRTGAGKTALVKQILKKEEASALDPEALSMQFLHNAPVIKHLLSWGVNLDPFYKYLWKHVCVLEMIRQRYTSKEGVPSAMRNVFDFDGLFHRGEKKTREAATDYLAKHGDGYWVRTDTRIKAIVQEMEDRVKSDTRIAAEMKLPLAKAETSIGIEHEVGTKVKTESEIVDRAQRILSDFLISDLNRVLDLLQKNTFSDGERPLYLVIDDLDKDWMPDDQQYLALIKALMFAARDVNHKLPVVKIVIALRDNIFHRLFKKASPHDPQREKWADSITPIQWTKEELIALLDKRVSEVFRQEFTQQSVTIEELLPEPGRRRHETALQFILARTLLRPRDTIDFVNTSVAQAASTMTRLTWAQLHAAERIYSQRRLDSIHDEWKDSFFGLPALYPMLRDIGPEFRWTEMLPDHLFRAAENELCRECKWLDNIATLIMQDRLEVAREEALKGLLVTGLVGMRLAEDNAASFSGERLSRFSIADMKEARFEVHPMFHCALGFIDRPAGSGS